MRLLRTELKDNKRKSDIWQLAADRISRQDGVK